MGVDKEMGSMGPHLPTYRTDNGLENMIKCHEAEMLRSGHA